MSSEAQTVAFPRRSPCEVAMGLQDRAQLSRSRVATVEGLQAPEERPRFRVEPIQELELQEMPRYLAARLRSAETQAMRYSLAVPVLTMAVLHEFEALTVVARVQRAERLVLRPEMRLALSAEERM